MFVTIDSICAYLQLVGGGIQYIEVNNLFLGAISQQFIEMQGGRIWAESELGKGSTFTFALPNKKVASP